MKNSPSFQNDTIDFDIADQSLLTTLGQAIVVERIGHFVTEKMLYHIKILDLYKNTYDLINADIWIN